MIAEIDAVQSSPTKRRNGAVVARLANVSKNYGLSLIHI